MARSYKPPPLQPLRIPAGWEVRCNKFYELDPDFRARDDRRWYFDEDMLQIVSESQSVILDLGWYPGWKATGRFGLVAVRIVADADMPDSWDAPLRELRTRSRRRVVRTLETWLADNTLCG